MNCLNIRNSDILDLSRPYPETGYFEVYDTTVPVEINVTISLKHFSELLDEATLLNDVCITRKCPACNRIRQRGMCCTFCGDSN